MLAVYFFVVVLSFAGLSKPSAKLHHLQLMKASLSIHLQIRLILASLRTGLAMILVSTLGLTKRGDVQMGDISLVI